MRLQVFGQQGVVPAVVDDDADEKELVRVLSLAANTPQGNGKQTKQKEETNRRK